MRGKKLFEEMGNVREDFVQDTAKSLYGEKYEKDGDAGLQERGCVGESQRGLHSSITQKRRHMFRVAVAAVVVMLIAGGLGIGLNGVIGTTPSQKDNCDIKQEEAANRENEKEEVSNKRSVKSTDYQVQGVSYPKENDTMEEPDSAYLKNLKPFYQQTMCDTLLNDKGENVAYSPVNLYFCMAMLTEMTDGQTRQQLLDALGQKDSANVREQSRKMWHSIYEDNDISKCVLGNSVWLNEDIPFESNVLQLLSENYYASTHQGQMGTKSFNKAIQNWVNTMTGNALKKQTNRIETRDDTVAMLLSSAYFYDQWGTPFDKLNTKADTFYNADGSRRECDFMKRTSNSYIYQTDRFESISLGFEHRKAMYIFLPNDGVTVDEMLQKDMEKILHITSNFGYEEEDKETEWGIVTVKLPKFQITTEKLDMIPTMENLGITDLFDMASADFRELLGEEEAAKHQVYADKVEQATKVAVDENGCSVASYTEVEMRDGAGMPEKEFTVNCNRPFLFVISDIYSGVPVFAGVVNRMD